MTCTQIAREVYRYLKPTAGCASACRPDTPASRLPGGGRDPGQLGSDRINAITAGPDALWVAAPTGLFRVDLAALP
jgi:hypothetical protein